MEQRGFNYCCGATELGQFAGTASDVEAALKTELSVARAQNKGYAICTLNGAQAKYRPVLTKTGFSLIEKYRNPNTGNTIFLYGKNLIKKTESRRSKCI